MQLNLCFASSNTFTADDIRSLWNVLAKSQPTTLQLVNLPQNTFLAADKVVQGENVAAAFLFKGTYFPIHVSLQPLQENGKLLSFTFTNPEQVDLLLSATISDTFFAWVMNTSKLVGTMLHSEIAFLSFEQKPNEYVNLELKQTNFSIRQYPLLFWFSNIQLPTQFSEDGGFAKLEQEDGSCFLLPPDLLEPIQKTI